MYCHNHTESQLTVDSLSDGLTGYPFASAVECSFTRVSDYVFLNSQEASVAGSPDVDLDARQLSSVLRLLAARVLLDRSTPKTVTVPPTALRT